MPHPPPRLALPAILIAAAACCAGEAAADCTCRAGGRDVELGRSVCLSTPAGFRLATCGMVLNNTSWRISATPCVDAAAGPQRLPQRSRPNAAPHAGG